MTSCACHRTDRAHGRHASARRVVRHDVVRVPPHRPSSLTLSTDLRSVSLDRASVWWDCIERVGRKREARNAATREGMPNLATFSALMWSRYVSPWSACVEYGFSRFLHARFVQKRKRICAQWGATRGYVIICSARSCYLRAWDRRCGLARFGSTSVVHSAPDARPGCMQQGSSRSSTGAHMCTR
jgi:hypothetical protein